MVFIALLKDGLSFMGLFWLTTTVWKAARGYPLHRWFV